jgi:hypothetical protein
VFDVLYMLIGHAHENEETALKLDPPDDFFRIRLVRQQIQTAISTLHAARMYSQCSIVELM